VQFHLLCTNPENFNPGGRPKLPTEIREMYQARSQVEVLTRRLKSDDDRIAMMTAQAILDRGYGKMTQLIDANITDDGGPVRYYAEVPKKAESTESWLASLGRVRFSRIGQGPLMTSNVPQTMSRGIRRIPTRAEAK
jgi:hypothetical protein